MARPARPYTYYPRSPATATTATAQSIAAGPLVTSWQEVFDTLDALDAPRVSAPSVRGKAFRAAWKALPAYAISAALSPTWPAALPLAWTRSAKHRYLTPHTFPVIVDAINLVPSRYIGALLKHLAEVVAAGGSLRRYETLRKLVGEDAATETLALAIGIPYTPLTPREDDPKPARNRKP
jgi:hypothetical protein